MKYLANENFSKSSIAKLRKEGLEVDSIAELQSGASDVEVLARAVSNRQVILTFDRDYGNLVFKMKLPAPIAVVYFRFSPSNPLEPFEIFQKFFLIEKTELENWFVVVERDGLRKRKMR